jgi:hypothetical protein
MNADNQGITYKKSVFEGKDWKHLQRKQLMYIKRSTTVRSCKSISQYPENGRSLTGILHLINQTRGILGSKQPWTVTCGSQCIAATTCGDQAGYLSAALY